MGGGFLVGGWVCVVSLWVVGAWWLFVMFEFWAWWLLVLWWLAVFRTVGLRQRGRDRRRERKNKKLIKKYYLNEVLKKIEIFMFDVL